MVHRRRAPARGQLHERLEALIARGASEPASTPDTWEDLDDRRRIDACVGLLLAYAAMRASAHPSSPGYVDHMAADAIGSFAWWCQCALGTCENDVPLGDRLSPDEIEAFVRSAHHHHDLDARLLAAQRRVFPAVGP